jgi:hypothetical protein
LGPSVLRLLDILFLFSFESDGSNVLRRPSRDRGSAGGELPLWKGFSDVNGLSAAGRVQASGSDSSAFIAGVVLCRVRRGAGLVSGSTSEERACLLVVRRREAEGSGGGTIVASTSSSGSGALVLLRPVDFREGGGSGMDSSSSTVLAWLDGTSTIPLDDGFVRLLAERSFFA